MTPLQVAQSFVERINAQDVDGLVALMAEDHHFTDSLGQAIRGRRAVRTAWLAYFGMVPDYRLTPAEWLCEECVVVMLGTAGGTYSPDRSLQPQRRWTTPVACRAAVHKDVVAEWRVYADNELIRQLMWAGAQQEYPSSPSRSCPDGFADTGKNQTESLVGRIVHASHDGRDLMNMFCLIAKDESETVTLVPIRTEIMWEDDCSGRERPKPPGEPAAALRACLYPEQASKHMDARGNPLFRQGILTYRLWDGRDVPCRYL